MNFRKNILPISIVTSAVVVFAFTLTNCSSGSSSSDGTSSSGGLSSFASTLAEDMVLSSPTTQRSGASVLSTSQHYYTKDDVLILEAPSPDDSPKEKKDALETLLSSTAPSSCAIALTIQSANRANCYGPSVSYVSHSFNTSSGTWPGGDLGIWEETEASTGEACAAAQLTKQMGGVLSYVDAGQFIVAGMACVANKNGDSLPAVGATIDMTSDMAGIVTMNAAAMTVTSATITRDSNDSSGNPVYVTSLVGTAASKTYSIRLKHISTSTDDSTNKGKISVKVTSTSPASTDGVSLEYEKASASSGKFLLKKINFNSSSADPFTSASNFTVDYNKAWNNNADYLIAELNPTTYAGTYAYAWQAGASDTHTRVFNAKLSVSGSAVTGTSFFGFGPTVASGAGSISGMICAWTGPDQSHVPAAKVQRQDLTLSSGKFTLSGTSHTTFDPVAACDTSSTSMVMTWNSGANTRATSNTVENLSPLSDVSSVIGSLPTAPAAVE